MKFRSVFFLLVALSALCAQTITRSRISVGYNVIQAGQMKTDLTYLASDALQGRLSLTKGSEEAIHWIEQQYRKAGVAPVAGDSYLQPVPLIEYKTDREKTGVTITHAGKRLQTLRYPEAYGSFPANVTVSGAVVFAGYGITAPELHYDDYAGINAEGKVALVFDHEPQENDAQSIFNGTGNTRYATSRVKVLNAQRHGAVGVLVVSEPNRKHPSNQERLARVRGMNQRARIPSQAIAGDEVTIPLFTISDAAAKELMGYAGKTPAAVQAAIDKDLRPASMAIPDATVEIRVALSTRREATSYNVVGLVEGSDPQLKMDTIIFSAHYDHDGPAPNNGIFHGADDNGSGTVGVVELARAFAKNPIKPRRSMLFAVFAAEERGLLGSYYYVQHPLRPLATTRAVINFDMIGRDETPSEQTKGLIDIPKDTTNELNLIGMKYSPDYRASVEQANNMVGLKLDYKWDEEAALNVYFRSDQFPFALKGIPAMWWFTGFHPDYHQTTDTVDRIDFPKMEKIVKLAYLTGWDFGDEATPPKFIANPAGAASSTK